MIPWGKSLKYSKGDILSKSLPLSSRFQDGSGIYFLIENSEIIYIGKATHLKSRIAAHGRKFSFDRVFIIYVDGWDARTEVERYYIKLICPRRNLSVNPIKKKVGVNGLFMWIDNPD